MKKDKTNEVYECIVRYMTETQRSPSMRDICNRTGIKSTNTVFRYLRILQSQDLIQITDNKSRSIVLNGYKLIKEE